MAPITAIWVISLKWGCSWYTGGMSKPTVLVEWDEPTHAPLSIPKWLLLSLLCGALVALGVGITLHDSSMYVASATGTVVAVSLMAQRKAVPYSHHLILTTESLTAGKAVYPLGTLAGFWLHSVQGVQTVSLIRKSSLVELSFTCPPENGAVKDALLEVLPEVSPPRERSLLPHWPLG